MTEKRNFKKVKRNLFIKIAVLMVLYMIFMISIKIFLINIMKLVDSNTAIDSLSSCVGGLVGVILFNHCMISAFDELNEIKDKEKENKKVS